MLLSIQELFKKWDIQADGVLHVGASYGQELEGYKEVGIKRAIWIEAIPSVYIQLQQKLRTEYNHVAFNECIGDEDGKTVTFNISSNHGESSSIFEFGTHAQVHQDVKFIRHMEMKTKRIDTLLYENGFDIADYQFVNIDLQGAELLALKSMEKHLDKVEALYLEVNKAHLYVGCPLIEEIDAYLNMFWHFERVETFWAGNTNWGDALYINRSINKTSH